MAINIASLCFLFPVFVFVFFPLTRHVAADTMNWSSVMFGGMILFSAAYYLAFGRKQYIPPVFIVKREQYGMPTSVRLAGRPSTEKTLAPLVTWGN